MEASGPRALVRKVGVVDPPLVTVGAITGLITVAALVGLAVDPREITGQPAWARPARFAISFGLFGVTLIWQAHRGQPLTSPDTATVTALTALAIATATATTAVFLHAHTTRVPPMPPHPG